MYISLQWVQNLTGLHPISLAFRCEKFTFARFEMEKILRNNILEKENFILDVS